MQVMAARTGKAAALRLVARQLGLERTEVAAIGDNANDLAMLRWAGIGVAMGNPPPAVQAAADLVTEGNDDRGVANTVRQLLRGNFIGVNT